MSNPIESPLPAPAPVSARADEHVFLSLTRRIHGLLVSPQAEWDVIDGEAADFGGIYRHHVIPLAAGAALAPMLGTLIFGGPHGLRPPIQILAGHAAIGFVFTLALVYIFARVIDTIGPSFGAQRNFGQAFKIAAYAPTIAWVGGLFLVLPALRFVMLIASIYTLYLLLVGVPKLMKPGPDQGVIYTFITIICLVILVAAATYLTYAVSIV